MASSSFGWGDGGRVLDEKGNGRQDDFFKIKVSDQLHYENRRKLRNWGYKLTLSSYGRGNLGMASSSFGWGDGDMVLGEKGKGRQGNFFEIKVSDQLHYENWRKQRKWGWQLTLSSCGHGNLGMASSSFGWGDGDRVLDEKGKGTQGYFFKMKESWVKRGRGDKAILSKSRWVINYTMKIDES